MKIKISKKEFNDRFDFLWTESYPGSLSTMWICIAMAIITLADLIITISNF